MITAQCNCSADVQCTYSVSFGTATLWPVVSCSRIVELGERVDCSVVNVEGKPICTAELREVE